MVGRICGQLEAMSEPIWHQYLSDRDRTFLRAQPRRRSSRAFGDAPVVLSVDNYRRVAGDHRQPILEQIETWPDAMGIEAWDALDRIATLFGVARSKDVPVVHVRDRSDLAPDMATRMREIAESSPEAADRFARRNELMPQAAPVDGELVIEKSTASAFFGTTLIRELVRLQVDTLVVVGESTSGCIRATVVDAWAHGFTVVVPEECVYDRHQATHAINLFDIDQKYGMVIPLADVIDHVEQTGSRRAGSDT